MPLSRCDGIFGGADNRQSSMPLFRYSSHPFLDLSLCGFITVIAFQKNGLRAALRVFLLFSEGMIIQAPWIFVQCSMFEHTLPEGYIIRASIIRICY